MNPLPPAGGTAFALSPRSARSASHPAPAAPQLLPVVGDKKTKARAAALTVFKLVAKALQQQVARTHAHAGHPRERSQVGPKDTRWPMHSCGNTAARGQLPGQLVVFLTTDAYNLCHKAYRHISARGVCLQFE